MRERSGSAVQSQPEANPGGGGVGLITDVVASSTSADQLRTRLGERMSRVADVGIRLCQLMHYETFLKPSNSKEHKVWVLIEYASWCCEAEGNLAGTISGKLAQV